jgi:DNA mismatch repair protein MutL
VPETPPARIRQLDDVTASRIAAGEVVERPASVVKELIENSLDAGASSVTIEIRDGGRRLIRVVDDGIGMDAGDVDLAIARHATSKLRTAADLERVRTLGFRGEALASIAAVSHLALTSRAAGAESAVSVRVEGGTVSDRQVVGAPRGTQVTVENLFYAVPARLKFLRSARSESALITQTVGRYALANPTCRFRLLRDGREALLAPGTGEMRDAVAAVLGRDVARSLVPVAPEPAALAWEDRGRGAVSVSGFVGPPHVHQATRKEIHLFVNGRPIVDSQLMFAVVQAYHGLLPVGRFPVAVVHLALPPEAVDVNVHPAKAEVRFREPRRVFASVQEAVRGAVVAGASVPSLREGPRPALWPGTTPGGPRPDWLGPAEGATPMGQPAGATGPLAPASAPLGGGQLAALDLDDRPPGGLPPLRPLGQVALAYIVAEGPDGLYLVDQHAAHERVLYEELRERGAEAVGQRLLAPESVPLTAVQAAVVTEHQEAFAAAGYELETFGHDTVLVRAVPSVLAGTDVSETIRAVIDLADEGRSSVDEAYDARLARAVCKRASVKAGQTLSLEEMRSLLRRLERTRSPRTCPHGRPTVVLLPFDRLEAEFGRHGPMTH